MAETAAEQRRTGGELIVLITFTLLCVGSLTLFTEFETTAGGVKLKPFDAFALLCVPPMLLTLVLGQGLRLTTGTLLFFAFMSWHSISAFTLNRQNGLRETLQTLELALIFLALQQVIDRINWRAVGKLYVLALAAILAYVAWWHISNGYIAGWKRIEGTKLLFTVLPTILLIFVVFNERRMSTQSYVLLGLMFVVILFAGERKALLHVGAMSVILLALGYFHRLGFAVALAFALAVAVVAAEANTYVAAQLATFSDLSAVRAVSTSELQAGYLPTTMSNAQRVFSAEVSRDLFQLYPMLGIGTNGFLDYVTNAYPGIARWLVVGIHNEFQRVLIENGLLGLLLYVAIWGRASLWLAMSWSYLPPSHRASYLFCLSCFFFQAFFEGSGNDMFLMLIFVALLPEIFVELLNRARGAEAPRPVRAWPGGPQIGPPDPVTVDGAVRS